MSSKPIKIDWEFELRDLVNVKEFRSVPAFEGKVVRRFLNGKGSRVYEVSDGRKRWQRLPYEMTRVDVL
jgi:hypothetical protein